MPQFEWDRAKAAANRAKHGVPFEEAATVLADPLSITIADPRFEEPRWVDIGMSDQGRLLVVVYTERGDGIRLVSSREATARERRQYESNQ